MSEFRRRLMGASLPLFAPDAGGGQAPNLQQQNAAARMLVLARSLDCMQQIFNTTIAAPGSGNNVINVPPRLVGLAKGFLVKIAGTIANSDAVNDATRTAFGPANVLSQITFDDLQNNRRIQTTGWHLNAVNNVRRRRLYGSAVTTDSPSGYGSNFGVMSLPATLAKASNEPFLMYFYVPLAYSNQDLRGAIYLNVVQANANLGLTLNPAPGAIAPADATLAMYSLPAGSVGAITLSNVTVTVYQSYLDQIPQTQKGPVLPMLDLSTVYELKNTANQGLTVGQDFPVPYANFRDFLSTTLVYDNAGTLNAGTDINYLALQAANFVNIWKIDPITSALMSRNYIGDDFPKGVYYFDHRDRPISTIQYGNLELIVNPSAVTAGASLLIGYEDMALLNTLTGAGSLAAG